MDDAFASLAGLSQLADTRPWVWLKRVCVCTNCNTRWEAAPILMRETRKDCFVKAEGTPLPNQVVKEHEAPSFHMRCEKCNGERPLRVSLQTAISASANDDDLAQRAGHILADWFKRRKSQPPGGLMGE